jgi:hypothetical protein
MVTTNQLVGKMVVLAACEMVLVWETLVLVFEKLLVLEKVLVFVR